jgi:outer membrane protein assembly factor BamE (lipoprotein component of BamABCDE complex)
MKAFLPILISIAAFALTSCNSASTRSTEKSTVFNTLDAQTQTRLKQSIIQVGDTTDMVYIALGHPDRIHEKTSATGRNEVWIYTAHWQEYEGPYYVGYRRPFHRDGYARRSYYEPFRDDLYRDYEEEYMRVIFQEDKVAAIEQMKR